MDSLAGTLEFLELYIQQFSNLTKKKEAFPTNAASEPEDFWSKSTLLWIQILKGIEF